MVNGKLERREEAIDLALGYRLNCVKARKRQPWTPKRMDLAFGVPAGCRMKHANGMFKRCGLGATLLPARLGVPSRFCTVCRV